MISGLPACKVRISADNVIDQLERICKIKRKSPNIDEKWVYRQLWLSSHDQWSTRIESTSWMNVHLASWIDELFENDDDECNTFDLCLGRHFLDQWHVLNTFRKTSIDIPVDHKSRIIYKIAICYS